MMLREAGIDHLLTPPQLAQSLRKLMRTNSIQSISQALLSAVENSLLGPTVFAIWLSVSHSPVAIRKALEQDISVEVRKSGIKELGKALKGLRWKDTWHGLGGTQGLLGIASTLSVRETRDFCAAIGCCARVKDVEEKREKVTELFKSLFQVAFPNTMHGNPDKRSLHTSYARLVPSCSPSLVRAVLEKTIEVDIDISVIPAHIMLLNQSDTLRALALDGILQGILTGRRWLSDLSQRYPPHRSADRMPGFSASMFFSLEVLQKMSSLERHTSAPEELIPSLVEPLVRRAIKRLPWQQIKDILDLTVRYLDRNRGAVKELSYSPWRLLHLVAICWSRQPNMFEEQFSRLLKFSSPGSERVNVVSFEPLMTGIAQSRRYALLRFCYARVVDQDLDNDEHLKCATGTLSARLLDELDPKSALALFTRLRKSRGDEELVGKGPNGAITNFQSKERFSRTLHLGDPDLFQIFLTHRSGREQDAEILGIKLGYEQRKKATSCSEQKARAYYAKSVLYYAIASGSLYSYKEALLWARRFVRDPLTVPELFQHYPKEAKNLLAGQAKMRGTEFDKAMIDAHIKIANEILCDLFETVVLASKEPSFHVNHWDGTLNLFHEVVIRRIELSKDLKTRLNLSEEIIYDTIWRDTLCLLTSVEEQALKPDHDRLQINSVNGILGYSEVIVKDEPLSTYRFMDDLAKARNDLWHKIRPTVFPRTASLPEPYPRGLPIQYLTGPFVVHHPCLDEVTPYIAARTNAAIFLKPAAALEPWPTDEDKQHAIGRLVDSYEFALKLYIPDCLLQEEKKMRVKKAWDYAIGPLSTSRMSFEEAIRYWESKTRHKFVELWPTADPDSRSLGKWPIMPSIDDPSLPEKWNPMPLVEKKIQTRYLEILTYIDVSKAISSLPHTKIVSKLEWFHPVIPGKSHEEDGIWHWTRTRLAKRVPAVREGQILSALLYLDARSSSKQRILGSPFPSQECARYPCFLLYDQFLSKADLNINRAIEALEAHLENVPPKLLAELTSNTLDALTEIPPGNKSSVGLEAMAFRLLILLTKCDRPELALDLAVRTIIEYPDSSSRHRQFLSLPFLRRLASTQTVFCIQKFSRAIVAKLEEQEETRKAAKLDSTDAKFREETNISKDAPPSRPVIKVTTVKFLAQLLRDTEIVPQEASLTVLTMLSQKAKHVDLKMAVVETLLEMLRFCSVIQSRNILRALESSTSAAGQLDSKNSISDEEWASCLSSSVLPKTSTSLIEPNRILEAILQFLIRVSSTFAHRANFTNRIVLPNIVRLKQETAKWIQTFLRHYGLSPGVLQELYIPPVPRQHRVWQVLLSHNLQYLPSSVLEDFHAYILFVIDPPAPIAALNRRLAADPHLRNEDTVKYWLLEYHSESHHRTQISTLILTMINVLSTSRPPQLGELGSTSNDTITTDMIQKNILTEYSTLLLSNAAHGLQNAELLTSSLAPSFGTSSTALRTWMQNTKPIIPALITFIDSLRTRAWQRDANRVPQLLPDTFPLRLHLLKYPSLPSEDNTKEVSQEEKCAVFAAQVEKLVDRMPGTVYHRNYEDLKMALKHVVGLDRILTAAVLGDVSKTRLSWLTAQDLLRVELAAGLLRGVDVSVEEQKLRGRLKELVGAWRMCESEVVRRFGWEMQIAGI
ncbi:hypothetical protein CC78DRAFT_537126 [Lojkania enalia]|uniref:Uncharacterized protein n=1 Tax=Lojkania enalia TaxID=147567 RepID=A0A9P4JZW6_9PLEO|nr:hypothetical protein CC78DRAFT_537126 [Didymosphaeria enalia]